MMVNDVDVRMHKSVLMPDQQCPYPNTPKQQITNDHRPGSRHQNEAIVNPELYHHESDPHPDYHAESIRDQNLDSNFYRSNREYHNEKRGLNNLAKRPAAAYQNSGIKKDLVYENQQGVQFNSGNSISGNTSRTIHSDSFSHPPAIVHDPLARHQNLLYMNRFVFPSLLALLVTGFGTSILIYTFTLERALPKRLTAVASISLVSVLISWGTLRIIEYCLWRRRIGRWHGTPTIYRVKRNEWEFHDHNEDSFSVLSPSLK